MSDDLFDDIEPEPEEAPAPKPTRRTRGPSRATKRIKGIEDALAKQVFTLGTMTGMILPVTGYYIASEADPFCHAIVQLAAKDARYLEALENVAAIGPGLAIGKTVIGIGCALGVDRWHRTEGEKGISPDKKAAMLLGVSAAYYSVYEEEGMSADDSYRYTPAPPSFIPVQ